MNDEITIFLTTQEAMAFRSFQQFHETFALMVKSGAFDVKSGSVTIHFDNAGKIQRIERKDDLYNSRSI